MSKTTAKMTWKEDYFTSLYNEEKQNQIITNLHIMEGVTIQFDAHKLAEFKIAFNEAKKRNDHYFMFDGQEFFIGYAKYAIEYLENEFNRKKQING